MKKRLISVIVTTFDSEAFIGPCIDSIRANRGALFEVIVVDDGSSDTTLSKLKKYVSSENVRVFRNHDNRGASVSRNIGAKKATGDILLFLDADATIDKGALLEVRRAMSADKKIGAVVLKLIRDRGKKLDNAGHFLTFFGVPYELGSGESPKKFQHPFPVFGAKTTGLAVRTGVFKLVGGFDEDYLIYGEDTDFSWRMWKAGFKVVFLPKAEGTHRVGGSLTSKTRERIYFEGTKNSLSNLIKNQSLPHLTYMLPLFVFAQVIIMVSLVLRGKLSYAFLIVRGIGWNIFHLPKTLKKRRQVRSYEVQYNRELYTIMFGSLDVRELLKKGLRWLKNV